MGCRIEISLEGGIAGTLAGEGTFSKGCAAILIS